MPWFTYLLSGLALVLVAVQLWGLWSARRQQGQPAPDYRAWVPPEQAGASRLLFYFYGERCGPCRALAPLVERLGREHPNLIKLDVAARPEAARGFRIMGTPTFVLVVDGRIERVILGGAGEGALTALLRGIPPERAR